MPRHVHQSHRPHPRLDPRAPLVLDTRELGRRAGSMRRARFTAPAPVALGTEVIGVPAGADVVLDLRLEAVMEGILVSGTARAPLAGECSRCLDPVEDTIEVELQQLYAYPDVSGDVPLAEDDEIGELVEDRLDLEPALRDAVVLALPLSPHCRQDCPGLCPTCGERLAELPPGHGHERIDPRWEALHALHPGADRNTEDPSTEDHRTEDHRTEDHRTELES